MRCWLPKPSPGWCGIFVDNPNVGAVTGNPRIRNRSTLLGRIQVGEFSAIVGMIKRAQRSYGQVFTVSGVIAAFRKSALHDVGYWSNDMVTEDIDISWKLQLAGWSIYFEPNALCWVSDAGNPARLMEAANALGAGRNRSVAALFSQTCFAGRPAACGCYMANA